MPAVFGEAPWERVFVAARTVCKIATDCGGDQSQWGHTVSAPAASPRPGERGWVLDTPTQRTGIWEDPGDSHGTGNCHSGLVFLPQLGLGIWSAGGWVLSAFLAFLLTSHRQVQLGRHHAQTEAAPGEE
jgi:hypothetical protein